jgi:hypothetical protein
VQAALTEQGIASFEFAFLITDVSSMIGDFGLVVNLSHHAWHFPDELLPEVSQLQHASSRSLGSLSIITSWATLTMQDSLCPWSSLHQSFSPCTLIV